MRPAWYAFGSVIVIGTALSLLVVASRKDPRAERAAHEEKGPIKPEHELPVVVPEPAGFPPQHTTPCDFSTYHPMRISDWLPGGIVKRATPSYPADARRQGIRGTVKVFVLINRDGAVERVCSNGPSALRKAAEAAAVQFRFRRPTINQGTDPFGFIQETLVFRFVPDGSQP